MSLFDMVSIGDIVEVEGKDKYYRVKGWTMDSKGFAPDKMGKPDLSKPVGDVKKIIVSDESFDRYKFPWEDVEKTDINSLENLKKLNNIFGR